MDLNNYREKWKNSNFDIIPNDCNPVDIFKEWLQHALDSNLDEPNAMGISTIGINGFPKTRQVLLKEVDDSKFIFYSNYTSNKAVEIAKNPKVSLNFYWSGLKRQVHIRGNVKKTSRERSEKYFNSRPKDSQIAAMISDQSSKVESRKIVEAQYNKALEDLREKKVICPINWGGYEVTPLFFEFWQGRSNRLHDRVCFELKDQSWKSYKLYP